MRRRVFLFFPLASRLAADAAGDVYNLLTRMAAALSQGNAKGFMDAVDESAPDYERLRGYITALAEQWTVLSSIEVLRNSGDEESRSLELDWFLQISESQPNGQLVRRRERISATMRRR